jgi:hypothetical protein
LRASTDERFTPVAHPSRLATLAPQDDGGVVAGMKAPKFVIAGLDPAIHLFEA